jgi:hypothetical protein
LIFVEKSGECHRAEPYLTMPLMGKKKKMMMMKKEDLLL